MVFQQQPVRRVDVDPPRDAPALDADAWPMTVPAVAQLASGGLPLRPGVTFLVGENGSGKSTVVEAIAEAYGLPAEGGSPNGGATTRRSESPLGAHLHLERSAGAPRWGFFLRAETMHGWYTFSEQSGGGPAYHELSHGESFLEVLRTRFDTPGFYCLDEPEAALSFSATLGLVARLAELAAAGAQIVCATHSPVLAALPGAHILELGPWGIREAAWDDLELVEHWRAYLAHPQRYLRHVLSDD